MLRNGTPVYIYGTYLRDLKNQNFLYVEVMYCPEDVFEVEFSDSTQRYCSDPFMIPANTATFTSTSTQTPTLPPSKTPAAIITNLPTSTRTNTPMPTKTNTPTPTQTNTPTPTKTKTPTPTNTTPAPINLPPIAVDDAYVTSKKVSISIPASSGVLANDSDPDGDSLTVHSNTIPANGKLTLHPDGSFTFDPLVFTGTVWFDYEVTDGNLLETARVTITVNDPKSTGR